MSQSAQLTFAAHDYFVFKQAVVPTEQRCVTGGWRVLAGRPEFYPARACRDRKENQHEWILFLGRIQYVKWASENHNCPAPANPARHCNESRAKAPRIPPLQ